MFFKKKDVETPPVAFTAGGVLACQGVTVTVDTGTENRTLLQDLTVELTAPTTAVLGLNGSGKSTFLRLFNGLVAPSQGRVLVHGVDVAQHRAQVRKRVGLLFSDPQAQLVMPTAVEDVELSLPTLKDRDARRARALELLGERGLAHRAEDSVYALSGGEKQLAALTSVLATDPQVLLLDEPTTLLDLRNRLALIDLLAGLPQQLVISTHDLDLAATCQEALVIHGGRLLTQGPATQVLAAYRTWCTTGFPSEAVQG